METQDIGKLLEEHTNKIFQKIDSLERRLDSLEEKISLCNDQIAFLRSTTAGEKAPRSVRRVPGGHGAVEPRTEWREERPYRR